jgi:hypothetical protein
MSKRKSDWDTPSEAITLERNGVTYSGAFQVERGMIRVSYRGDSKATQLGEHPAPASVVRTYSGDPVRPEA